MALLSHDFGRLVGRIFRYVRILSYGFILVMLVWMTVQVADIYRSLSGVHPYLGYAFLGVTVLLVVWLIGRPLYAFFRMPVVARPPRLPPPDERRPRHVARYLDFMERYLRHVRSNPEWEGAPQEIDGALTACRALREEAMTAAAKDMAKFHERVKRLEADKVEPLLAPLDRKASDAIRNEALRIGLVTAASPYGTLDAFLVLWRNVNLVSRIARIYYGRPGLRGTLTVLRDVSMATMAGAYLQDLSEFAGEMVASFAGKAAGFLAGPLLDGSLNAVATVRIGYVAKARCRAYEAWTEKTVVQALRGALLEAGRFSKGVVTDLVRSVGGGLLKLPGRILGGLIDRVGGLFRKPAAGTQSA